MKLAVLTHYVTDYRLPVFVALAERIERLTLVLSSEDSGPGLPRSGLDVRVLRSWKLPRVRHHPGGFAERYTVHLPVGVGQALADIRPDVIHAHEFGLRTAGAALYKLRHRVPMIVHADLSEHTEQGRGRARAIARRLLLKTADRVAVNGASGARYIESLGFDPARIDRLPFATDTAVFHGQPAHAQTAPQDAPLRLLFVGRLIELKGIEPFIRALGAVLADHPDRHVELTLAGSGERAEALSALPRPPNLTLYMPGAVDYKELPSVYAQADVFVFPSLCDTWGLVVNEAMAMGLPVLGSVLAQASEQMIRTGENGWRYDPRDATDTRQAIQSMLNTPAANLEAMGARAHEAALALAPEHVAGMMLESCHRALGAPRG